MVGSVFRLEMTERVLIWHRARALGVRHSEPTSLRCPHLTASILYIYALCVCHGEILGLPSLFATVPLVLRFFRGFPLNPIPYGVIVCLYGYWPTFSHQALLSTEKDGRSPIYKGWDGGCSSLGTVQFAAPPEMVVRATMGHKRSTKHTFRSAPRHHMNHDTVCGRCSQGAVHLTFYRSLLCRLVGYIVQRCAPSVARPQRRQ